MFLLLNDEDKHFRFEEFVAGRVHRVFLPNKVFDPIRLLKINIECLDKLHRLAIADQPPPPCCCFFKRCPDFFLVDGCDRCDPWRLFGLANIFKRWGPINPLRCNSTILCLNKFDCRPIREPSMDMPASIHLRNRHARQLFLVIVLITQLFCSAHLKRGGTLSRNVRRKNPLQPLKETVCSILQIDALTSQVVTPKWIPDEGSWQMAQGIVWKISSIFGLGLPSRQRIDPCSVRWDNENSFLPESFIPTWRHLA